MATSGSATPDHAGRAQRGSMRRDRRRALIWSYVFLMVFVVFFLTPPIYMFITSLKTSAEISAGSAPWWVSDPTLRNYVELLTSPIYLTFFRNSIIVALLVVVVTMVVSILAVYGFVLFQRGQG